MKDIENSNSAPEHNNDNCFYHNAINEDGWFCSCCGELGFRPDLDKKFLWRKIDGILQDLHEHKFINVSNGSQGEFIVHNVYDACFKEERFDQYFILKEILNEPNIDVKGHSDYWKKHVQELNFVKDIV